MTEFSVIIPARFASVRFPGKPLHLMAGKPMIAHVIAKAQRAGAQRVVVATDDARIAEAARTGTNAGVQVVMTSEQHPSGTDRVMEAATALGLGDDEIVVNVQGDEPLIPPATIRQAADLVAGGAADVASLWEPIRTREELLNPNAVKVVLGEEGLALYFSRSPIPFLRDLADWQDRSLELALESGVFKRHVGIYGYRVSALGRFVALPPGQLEQQEKLEQLRLLAHGIPLVLAAAVERIPAGVDTPADAERVTALLAR